MFLWLLTPFSGPQEEGEKEEEGEEEKKSCYSSLVEKEKDVKEVPSVRVECVVGGEGETNTAREGEEQLPPYRKRLSTFVHLPTSGEDGTSPSRRNSVRQRQPTSSPQPNDKGHDVWQTFHIVTETVGYILWHSVDYDRQRPPWKVWGSVLSSLDSFTSTHPLILPAYLVKQRYIPCTLSPRNLHPCILVYFE